MEVEAWTAASGGGAAQVHWLVTDQLGTPRMVFDQSGSLANTSRHDYLPFGEELFAGMGGRTTAQGYVGDNVRQKFTSKERDSETGLDYFGARYYSSLQGRFTSVDPSRKSIITANPQSWNRYSYTYNNPLALVDDNGKWPTGTHDALIKKAFPGLTHDQIRQIQKGSASVDVTKGVPITLIESQAYKHAMTPGSYVREMGSEAAARVRAVGEMANFVITNEVKASGQQSAYAQRGGSGLAPDALFTLGVASHPLTDNTSPAHAGFQIYSVPQMTTMVPVPGVPGGVIPVTTTDPMQFKKELEEHAAREAGPPTPEEDAAAVKELRTAFGNVFGQDALQRAITPPPPGPIPQPPPDPRRRPE